VSAKLPDRLRRLLEGDGRSPEERERLVTLMSLIAELPEPPDPLGLYPDYRSLREEFLASSEGADGEVLEEAFLHLYCHLHLSEAPYTEQERRRVDETGGYWCHAGGLSPVLKAGPHIRPDTVLGDFGAGNGLQGLLIQRLDPHRLTVQIEISSRAVTAGKALQGWLAIPEKRVRWVVGDVLDESPGGMDFVYLYRPVRPTGEGRIFYERFAADLARSERPVVVFSIADCLRDFLPPAFEIFYTDGHLTCFRRRRG
jgi:hypothetical protein